MNKPNWIPGTSIIHRIELLLSLKRSPSFVDQKIQITRQGSDCYTVCLFLKEPTVVFDSVGTNILTYKQGMWCQYLDQLIQQAEDDQYIDDSELFGEPIVPDELQLSGLGELRKLIQALQIYNGEDLIDIKKEIVRVVKSYNLVIPVTSKDENGNQRITWQYIKEINGSIAELLNNILAEFN